METILTEAVDYYGGAKAFKQHLESIEHIILEFHHHYTPDVDVHFKDTHRMLNASYDYLSDFFTYYTWNILVSAYELKENPALMALTCCVHENSHRNDPKLEENIDYINELVQDEQILQAREVEFTLETTAKELGIQFIQDEITHGDNPLTFNQSFLDLFCLTQMYNLKAYQEEIDELKKELNLD